MVSQLSAYLSDHFGQRAWSQRRAAWVRPSRGALSVASLLSTCDSPQASPGSRPREIWPSPVRVVSSLTSVWSTIVHAHTTLVHAHNATVAAVRSQSLIQLVRGKSDLLQRVEGLLEQAAAPEPAHAATQVDNMAQFLRPAGAKQLEQAAMLADLSNLAYDVSKLSAAELLQRYNLRLRTSSQLYSPHEEAPSCAFAAEVWAELEAIDMTTAGVAQDLVANAASGAASNNIVPTPAAWKAAREAAAWRSARQAVNNAVHAAEQSEGSVAVQTVQQMELGGGAAGGAARDAGARLPQQPSAAQQPKQGAAAPADGDGAAPGLNPAEWFVCDDAAGVRYISIQGSISSEHWRINLTFDPVPFEGDESGIKVHRGIYHAALQLYDVLLPLVQEHLDCHPNAKICFTGHSLGGSLSTMLLLLLVQRGVLRPSQALPTTTFGAPAVFSEGASGASGFLAASTWGGGCGPGCGPNCAGHSLRKRLGAAGGKALAAAAVATAGIGLVTSAVAGARPRRRRPAHSASDAGGFAGVVAGDHEGLSVGLYGGLLATLGLSSMDEDVGEAQEGLLQRLGLGEGAITNVIMHRDIVPRAFVCDYTAVAGVLRSWGPSFKELASLAACRPHKVLYHFLGTVQVLQPGPASGFVLPSDESHPMLPSAPNLYTLVDPPGEADLYGAGLMSHDEYGSSGSGGGSGLFSSWRTPRPSLGDAILSFMNAPHPLQMLGDVASYGPNGSISRFHNPYNYHRGLAALMQR